MVIVIVFLCIVVALVLIIWGIARLRHEDNDDDHQYLNEEGDHLYYERSLITKKKYARRHPNEAMRTLRRLFGKKE